jgi:hypothetical protein
MNWLLVIIFSVIFPLAHIANGWVFSFAEISPHISLIYLPAFLRLANVLILGRLHGSLATLIGGLLLMWYSNEASLSAWLNSVCSAGGPLLALFLFKLHVRREVELTSLKDLTVLTLLYAMSNAVLHHVMWSIVDRSNLVEPSQMVWMILGDIFGALLGAYIMKWGIVSYRHYRLKADLHEH